MRALLFGVEPEADGLPMALRDLDDPQLPADDWVLLRTRLCGICGSDAKQVFLDGEPDNAMTALISFPQVLGHELVADVVGEDRRVVLNPWLSCVPRGIQPVCAACAEGDLSLCHSFADGQLTPGIHVGNSSQAPGGFGELVAAHESMCVDVPGDVPDEVAVLADPFSVSLHAVVRNPPPDAGRVLVYGAGALGITTCAVLRALHPGVEVAAVARFEAQAQVARGQGARVLPHEPAVGIVDAVAAWTGARVRTPFTGLPWLHPSGVDAVYDTVGSPATLEVGLRVVRPRGTIVVTGVATPGRFEWTPWYFKELRVVGSNAFGIEKVEGVRKHAMEHYFDLVRAGRVDVRAMLTHTFRLDDWRQAFAALADQAGSGAVKVGFDLR